MACWRTRSTAGGPIAASVRALQPLPNTQAITFSDADPERLTLEENPTPEPGPPAVLVRVRVAGINPVDWKTRQGAGVRGFFDASSPMVLGWDVAGEVVEVGAGVTRFAVGDRVFGMPRFPHPAAAFAEFVASPSRHLARIPDGVSFEVAGAVPPARSQDPDAHSPSLAVPVTNGSCRVGTGLRPAPPRQTVHADLPHPVFRPPSPVGQGHGWASRRVPSGP